MMLIPWYVLCIFDILCRVFLTQAGLQKRSINVGGLDDDLDASYGVPPESPLVPSMDKLYSPSLRKATAMRH